MNQTNMSNWKAGVVAIKLKIEWGKVAQEVTQIMNELNNTKKVQALIFKTRSIVTCSNLSLISFQAIKKHGNSFFKNTLTNDFWQKNLREFIFVNSRVR